MGSTTANVRDSNITSTFSHTDVSGGACALCAVLGVPYCGQRFGVRCVAHTTGFWLGPRTSLTITSVTCLRVRRSVQSGDDVQSADESALFDEMHQANRLKSSTPISGARTAHIFLKHSSNGLTSRPKRSENCLQVTSRAPACCAAYAKAYRSEQALCKSTLKLTPLSM